MCKTTLYLIILATSLAVCWAKPADIFARVPSSFYRGTKWVLFRDDNISNPPPNVIQAENNVQVLPSNQYQEQKQFGGYFDFITPSPVQAGSSIKGDYDTEVVDNNDSSFLPQYPTLDFGHLFGDFQISVKHHINKTLPAAKVASAKVIAVPQTAVTIQGPAYIDYLRNKKNV